MEGLQLRYPKQLFPDQVMRFVVFLQKHKKIQKYSGHNHFSPGSLLQLTCELNLFYKRKHQVVTSSTF